LVSQSVTFFFLQLKARAFCLWLPLHRARGSH
jgi:hypothetical protein